MKSKTVRKPKPPVISQEILEELYKQAMAYYDLAPWSLFSENDLFAFQDPIAKQTNYCCILGGAGDFLGITVYRGRVGLEMHTRILEEEDLSDLEIFDNYDALVVEFSPKKDLEKPDVVAVNKINASLFPAEIYPCFRSYLPGFQGWFLSEKEALSLILTIKCAVAHTLNCQKDPSFKRPKGPGAMLLYTVKTEKNETSLWEITDHSPGFLPTKKQVVVPLDLARLEKLKGMKLCHDTAWEASIFMTPSVILDKNRPYYAKICLVAHQESFLVLQVKILELHSCFYTTLSELILSSIETNKRLPSEILVNDKETLEALKPLSKALGIQIAFSEDLPAIALAQEHLLEYME